MSGAGGPPDRDFWRGRRVFLTGHTGFKGSWAALVLERLGAVVTGFSLPPPTVPSLYEAAGVGAGLASIVGDIRDAGALSRAMAEAEPEIVLHLAAQALVLPARAAPADTFATNLMGTVHLLEAVRATPSVRAAVIVTSDKVYDNVEWVWPYREGDRLGGREPYGASKAACEIAVESWRHSYFDGPERRVGLATARAGNIVGGGDWAGQRLVPDAMRAFPRGEPLVVRNPDAVRPWQHVLEPVMGYLALAQHLHDDPGGAPRAVNFGPAPEDAKPVSWLAERMVAAWGPPAAWEVEGGARPYEARHLSVDSSLAAAALAWQPVWRLEEALHRTVAWYRDVHRGAEPRARTLADIDAHLGLGPAEKDARRAA